MPCLLLACLILTAGAPAFAGSGGRDTPVPAAPEKPRPKVEAAAPSAEPWTETPCSAHARPPDAPEEAVARVNGRWIFLFEVDDLIVEERLQVEEALADARVRELHLRINRRLLEQEAARRRLSVDELLKREVVEKTADPTEQDVRQYYEKNIDRYGPDFNKVRARIRARLRMGRESAVARRYADTLRKAAALSVVEDEIIRPGLPADPKKVLARINGTVITVADIERGMKPLVAQAQGQTHTLRTNALDRLINDRLLQEAAERDGLPPEELLSREIRKRMQDVNEVTARRFYARNRKRIETDINTPQGLQSILHYLKEQELQKATLAYSESLREQADVLLFLPSPESPRFEIDTRDQPAVGPQEAPVTVVAFLDFQCGACAWLHGHVAELMNRHKGKIRFVARDFPLKAHTHAYQAALAAEAAREQGRYWDYAHLLMNNQSELDEPQLLEYAARLGLDVRRFRAAMGRADLAERIERDRREALRLGLEGTPGVFLNGQRVRLKSAASLDEALESALAAAREKA